MIYSMHWIMHQDEFTIPISYGNDYYKQNYLDHPHYKHMIPLAGKVVNLKAALALFIRESSDDSFVFIVTKKDGRYREFRNWIKAEKLEEYEVIYPIVKFTNPNYTDTRAYGKDTVGNLRLAVLVSKNHSMREHFKAKNPLLIKEFNSIESAI